MTVQEFTRELEMLKDYFETATIPTEKIKQEGYASINDPRQYIQTNLTVAAHNIGNPWFEGTLIRLRWIKNYIEQN